MSEEADSRDTATKTPVFLASKRLLLHGNVSHDILLLYSIIQSLCHTIAKTFRAGSAAGRSGDQP